MIIRKLLVSALTILIMGMGTNETLAAPLIEMPAQIIAGESSIDDVVVDAFEAAASGVKVMLPYADNKVYRIYCQEGFITDLIMAPGEEILSIVGSDSERWKIETSVTGTVVKQLHVFVKPIRRGLEANIIINTNRHVYNILARSGSYHNPMVEWLYPQSNIEYMQEEKTDDYLALDPEKLNFQYQVNKKNLTWSPERVFDDGKKTYIKMKDAVKTSAAPAFFVIDPKGKLELANYRVLRGYYIVDRLFEEGSLILGSEKIKIKRR